MLYLLWGCSIFLSLIFFCYNKFFLKIQTEVNIVHTTLFLFISVLIAYLVNRIWNIEDTSVPPPKASKDDNSDNSIYKNIDSSLKQQLKNVNKLTQFI